MKKLKTWWGNLKYKIFIHRCYKKQIADNLAIFDLCKGKSSDNTLTNFVDESCLSCPYYFNPNKGD